MPKKLDLNARGGAANNAAITLYHGTIEPDLVPVYGKGLARNDYGQGFYTTDDLELAKEWACGRRSKTQTAFVYMYTCNMNELSVFDFRELKRNTALYWITELLSNRTIDSAEDYYGAVEFLLKHFHTDAEQHDVIIGARADDSYFKFAEAFIASMLGLEVLSFCLEAGNLGVQYCIKSERAFGALNLSDRIILTSEEYTKYNELYAKRDRGAREYVRQLMRDNRQNIRSAIYLIDIMRNWRD